MVVNKSKVLNDDPTLRRAETLARLKPEYGLGAWRIALRRDMRLVTAPEFLQVALEMRSYLGDPRDYNKLMHPDAVKDLSSPLQQREHYEDWLMFCTQEQFDQLCKETQP